MSTTLWTIGHSTRPIEEFLDASGAYEIELVADVLTSLGVRVVHIRDARHAEEHRLTAPARLVGGRLTYAP